MTATPESTNVDTPEQAAFRAELLAFLAAKAYDQMASTDE